MRNRNHVNTQSCGADIGHFQKNDAGEEVPGYEIISPPVENYHSGMNIFIEYGGEIIWAVPEVNHFGECIAAPSLAEDGVMDRIISALEGALGSARLDKENYRNSEPSEIIEIPEENITYASE